jgi:hypothetical protein
VWPQGEETQRVKKCCADFNSLMANEIGLLDYQSSREIAQIPHGASLSGNIRVKRFGSM